jgi:hypothetical protein
LVNFAPYKSFTDMKKIHILLLLVALTGIFSTGCNEYRSLSSASKVSQLSGNPFMYQLSKSVMKTLGNYMLEKGIKSTVGKINLMSPLSGLFSNSSDLSGLKDLLVSTYKIAPKKADAQFGNLQNVRDLIGFVAKNGKNFNFYNSKI